MRHAFFCTRETANVSELAGFREAGGGRARSVFRIYKISLFL